MPDEYSSPARRQVRTSSTPSNAAALSRGVNDSLRVPAVVVGIQVQHHLIAVALGAAIEGGRQSRGPRRAWCARWGGVPTRRQRQGAGRLLVAMVVYGVPELQVLRTHVGVELGRQRERELLDANQFLHVGQILEPVRRGHA